MTRTAWLAHMTELFGSLTRTEAFKAHMKAFQDCPSCLARHRTRKANRNSRDRHAARVSLGLKRTPYGYE